LADVGSALEESRDEALMTLKTILRPNARPRAADKKRGNHHR
jgi:hypothetical protein